MKSKRTNLGSKFIKRNKSKKCLIQKCYNYSKQKIWTQKRDVRVVLGFHDNISCRGVFRENNLFTFLPIYCTFIICLIAWFSKRRIYIFSKMPYLKVHTTFGGLISWAIFYQHTEFSGLLQFNTNVQPLANILKKIIKHFKIQTKTVKPVLFWKIIEYL